MLRSVQATDRGSWSPNPSWVAHLERRRCLIATASLDKSSAIDCARPHGARSVTSLEFPTGNSTSVTDRAAH